MECRQVCGEKDNLKLRMWNFDCVAGCSRREVKQLVALRAMLNYSMKNYKLTINNL